MESDRDRRSRLIWEAKGRGDVSYLIQAAQTDAEFRDVAAQFLGEVGDAAAVGPLVALISDSNPQVRAAAVRSLGRLRAREASAVLFKLAREDPVFFVRDWSMQALAEIGEPDVIPLALNALNDEDVRIRRSAAIVLGRVGGKAALDQLRRAKKRDRLLRRSLYREASSQIRQAARRRREPGSPPSTSPGGASRMLSRAASAAAVVLGAFLVWSALSWADAPVWIRIAATMLAVLVCLRYLFLRMRHRSRRSRLSLREPADTEKTAPG